MRGLSRALLATAAVVGLVSTASAADLAYKVKAPVMATPAYSWSGFYGGLYGGMGSSGAGGTGFTGDPGAVNTVEVGPAANGSQPIFSAAYNNLANGGIGQVTNLINPTGVNCLGLVNCNIGGNPTTSITPNTNPGYRTDAMLPSSAGAAQLAGLFGVELGYRQQFEHVVLGIGADWTGFSHGGSNSYNSNGSFYNSNGFTGNSQVTGCIDVVVLGTCQQAQSLNTSGSVQTINTGGSSLNLAVNSNPNWIGTVRASAGYAWDRVLVFASGGLAYSTGGLSVTGSYRDTATSACSGVSNLYAAAGNGAGQPGFSQVNYSCGGTPLNSASVAQVTTTNVTFSGNHGGGMLTGFAGGGGAAYAITDHISLLFEGLYYNLGTVRTTVTGTGTSTTTTTTTNIIPAGGVVVNTATAAATMTPITVARMIDGMIFKGGIQFKF